MHSLQHAPGDNLLEAATCWIGVTLLSSGGPLLMTKCLTSNACGRLQRLRFLGHTIRGWRAMACARGAALSGHWLLIPSLRKQVRPLH